MPREKLYIRGRNLSTMKGDGKCFFYFFSSSLFSFFFFPSLVRVFKAVRKRCNFSSFQIKTWNISKIWNSQIHQTLFLYYQTVSWFLPITQNLFFFKYSNLCMFQTLSNNLLITALYINIIHQAHVLIQY